MKNEKLLPPVSGMISTVQQDVDEVVRVVVVRDPTLISDVERLALVPFLGELDAAVELLDLNVDPDRLQLLLDDRGAVGAGLLVAGVQHRVERRLHAGLLHQLLRLVDVARVERVDRLLEAGGRELRRQVLVRRDAGAVAGRLQDVLAVDRPVDRLANLLVRERVARRVQGEVRDDRCRRDEEPLRATRGAVRAELLVELEVLRGDDRVVRCSRAGRSSSPGCPGSDRWSAACSRSRRRRPADHPCSSGSSSARSSGSACSPRCSTDQRLRACGRPSGRPACPS